MKSRCLNYIFIEQTLVLQSEQTFTRKVLCSLFFIFKNYSSLENLNFRHQSLVSLKDNSLLCASFVYKVLFKLNRNVGKIYSHRISVKQSINVV